MPMHWGSEIESFQLLLFLLLIFEEQGQWGISILYTTARRLSCISESALVHKKLERFIREGLPSDRPKASLLDDSIEETCFSYQVATDAKEESGEGIRLTFPKGPNSGRDHRRSLR